MLPLNSHHAAGLQTGSLGDTAICFVGENPVITTYEMKMKCVTQDDIDAAVAKITRTPTRIHKCLLVTTDAIDSIVTKYIATFCRKLAVLILSLLIASNLCSTFCTHSIAFERIVSALIRRWFWTSQIHLPAKRYKKHFRDCARLRKQ